MSDGLERAREELDAARLLTDNDFGGPAVSRAYNAAFYAAEAALAVLGETRSKHSGVISAFGKLVVKEGRLGPGGGQVPPVAVRAARSGRLLGRTDGR